MATIGTFDGKACSTIWVELLEAARLDGVKFVLNSGHRSFAEQVRLYDLYIRGEGPKAAKPGTSTHNKIGWQQGVDIGPNPESVTALRNWAKVRLGITLNLTVPGEWWHLNATADFTAKVRSYRKKQARRLRLKKWRDELAKRRKQLVTEKKTGTRAFLIRRINALKKAIKR